MKKYFINLSSKKAIEKSLKKGHDMIDWIPNLYFFSITFKKEDLGDIYKIFPEYQNVAEFRKPKLLSLYDDNVYRDEIVCNQEMIEEDIKNKTDIILFRYILLFLFAIKRRISLLKNRGFQTSIYSKELLKNLWSKE